MSLKLYTYFRSSAAYRVRIALNLKGLDVDMVPIHLLRKGGEQLSEAYRSINPEALVPALVDDNDDEGTQVLTQSIAIMEYLDEMYSEPPLLPSAPLDRAYVRGIALSIACDIHPINNLRVLRYLVRELGASEDAKNAWYRHWCENGLTAIEKRISADGRAGKFCLGDTPTMADCCLVPQLANARRVDTDLSRMPTLLRIAENCAQLDAFTRAEPARQPDAE
jgi:maleylacetoacetate isomerase